MATHSQINLYSQYQFCLVLQENFICPNGDGYVVPDIDDVHETRDRRQKTDGMESARGHTF